MTSTDVVNSTTGVTSSVVASERDIDAGKSKTSASMTRVYLDLRTGEAVWE